MKLRLPLVSFALLVGLVLPAAAQTFPAPSSQLAPSANPTFSGTTTVSERLDLTGVISAAQITSNQNDYAPTGLATAAVLRLSTDASRNLTGLTGGSAGRVLVLHNVGTSDLVLKDASSSSTAANRFTLGGADLTLTGGKSVILQYDGTSSRWRAIGGGGGASVSLPLAATDGGTGQTSFTKGDLLVATGSSALTKLGLGTDGQVLTADSAQTSGVKWADAGGGSLSPIILYVKDVAVLTSGAPADVAAINLPAGVTRWVIQSTSNLDSQPQLSGGFAVTETGGPFDSASFSLRPSGGGGGTEIGLVEALDGSVGIGAQIGRTYFGSGSTIYIRQNSASDYDGTVSFYVTIYPLP